MRTESLEILPSDVGPSECDTNRKGKATSWLRSAREFRYCLDRAFHFFVVVLSRSLDFYRNSRAPAAKCPGRGDEYPHARYGSQRLADGFPLESVRSYLFLFPPRS